MGQLGHVKERKTKVRKGNGREKDKPKSKRKGRIKRRQKFADLNQKRLTEFSVKSHCGKI